MDKKFDIRNHPVLANILIIFIVAIIGLFIVFLSLNLFTRHGETDKVPNVENMSFTNAVKILHASGFRTDIRDSVFNEDIKPGYVIEQFPRPGAEVKPGRKIFLYINAVHTREVIIDAQGESYDDALKGYSLRQGLAKLEEMGFRHVNVVRVPGDNDRIIKLKANGHVIKKLEKVPVTAKITLEAYDGQLSRVTDSILDEEYYQYVTEEDSMGYLVGDDNDMVDDEPAFVQ